MMGCTVHVLGVTGGQRSLCLAPPTGHIVFAIGFADADYSELVSMASQPVDRHVFFVDDLDAFQKIEEKLVTFVCEAASASEPPVSCLLAHYTSMLRRMLRCRLLLA